VDGKTREELNGVIKTMRDEGYAPEALAKGRAEGERSKTFLFNEESYAKMRVLAEKNAAGGKPNAFPLPDVGKKSELEGKVEGEKVVGPLD